MRSIRMRFTGCPLRNAVAVAWAAFTILWAALTILVTTAADANLAFGVNAASAIVVPSALLAGMVAIVEWAVAASMRIDGPRFKVREAVLVIALLGLGLGTARWWVRYHFETVYAPGYSEGRFSRIRVGM